MSLCPRLAGKMNGREMIGWECFFSTGPGGGHRNHCGLVGKVMCPPASLSHLGYSTFSLHSERPPESWVPLSAIPGPHNYKSVSPCAFREEKMHERHSLSAGKQNDNLPSDSFVTVHGSLSSTLQIHSSSFGWVRCWVAR